LLVSCTRQLFYSSSLNESYRQCIRFKPHHHHLSCHSVMSTSERTNSLTTTSLTRTRTKQEKKGDYKRIHTQNKKNTHTHKERERDVQRGDKDKQTNRQTNKRRSMVRLRQVGEMQQKDRHSFGGNRQGLVELLDENLVGNRVAILGRLHALLPQLLLVLLHELDELQPLLNDGSLGWRSEEILCFGCSILLERRRYNKQQGRQKVRSLRHKRESERHTNTEEQNIW